VIGILTNIVLQYIVTDIQNEVFLLILSYILTDIQNDTWHTGLSHLIIFYVLYYHDTHCMLIALNFT